MSKLVDPSNIILHDRQIQAAARIIAKRLSCTQEVAETAVRQLATHDVTDDTYWRQGLYCVFVVYSGTTTKIAEICIEATEAYDNR